MSTVYTDDYTKTTYRNDNPPALDQTNLNNSENGIKTLSGRVATLSSELSAEVSARTNADTAEVSARNSAISSAVSAEATARDSAISSAISTEVSNRNTAISSAISTEVTNRNSAIGTAVDNVNGDLKNLNIGHGLLYIYDFKNGDYRTDTHVFDASITWCVSSSKFVVDKKIIMVIGSGYRVRINYWNADGTWESSEVKQLQLTLNSGEYVSLTIFVPNEYSGVADVHEFVDSIYYTSPLSDRISSLKLSTDLNFLIAEAELMNQREIDKHLHRSLDYLWKLSKGVVYDEEEVTSYAKDVTVPSGAKEYASMDMLGGMSRKGKNLLNPTLQTETKNGVTCTYHDGTDGYEKGTYTLNGTATAASDFYLLSEPDSTFTLPTTCKVIGFNSPSLNKYYFAMKNISTGEYAHDVEGTAPSGTYKYLQMYVKKGTVLDNVVCKPMLTLDTSATYSDYEPYTASLIDAKVDKVVSEGANRLQSSDFVVGEYINNNGDTASAGVNTRATNHEYIDISSMTTAYVSFHNGTNYSLIYATYDGDKKLITRSAISTSKKEHTIATNGAKYLRICPFADTDLTGVDFKCVVSSVSTTDYSPYVKHETTLPTSVTSLDGYGIGINNTCYNYLEYTGDKVYFHKKCKAITQTFTTSTKDSKGKCWNCGHIADAVTSYSETEYPIISDKYDSAFLVNCRATDGTICLYNGELYVHDDSVSDTYSKEITIYYELAEESVTDVTSYFSYDSEILSVEPNGKVTFHYSDIDTYDVDVPSKITYIVDVSEVTSE